MLGSAHFFLEQEMFSNFVEDDVVPIVDRNPSLLCGNCLRCLERAAVQSQLRGIFKTSNQLRPEIARDENEEQSNAIVICNRDVLCTDCVTKVSRAAVQFHVEKGMRYIDRNSRFISQNRSL